MMKVRVWVLLCAFVMVPGSTLRAQSSNCFLEDFAPKFVRVPPYADVAKVTAGTSIIVTCDAADTIAPVSKYIFGNAVAVWVGTNQNNPTLVGYMKKLAPSFIRFPGGSWSDIYFWNGVPADVPVTIPDGTNNGAPINLSPQSGAWYPLTPAQYYQMRDAVSAQGLITVNFGYSRYGLSDKPLETAAHLAAEMVRYDDGRTMFWEIGNENGGPWEAGYQIDTATNKDGQPKIINGALYAKHFRVFADSMRAAAEAAGNPIYIGGQILHFDGSTSYNVPDRGWNEAFFRDAADKADFYVMHNYFSANNSSNAGTLLNWGHDEIIRNAAFIEADIAAKGARRLPVALTEYNMGTSNTINEGSIIKGMQAVILYGELARLKFGLASRWLAATNENGMFYDGSNGSIPKWNARPEFYYAYYAQRFTGDHILNTSVSGTTSVNAYASSFASGHIGIMIVNKAKTNYTIEIQPQHYGFGDRFYVYSVKGGTDNGDFSQEVWVNGIGPTAPAWGPMDVLDSIKAMAYPTNGTDLKLTVPGRSVQFILVEPGSHTVTDVAAEPVATPEEFALEQNYPNPFNPSTTIAYTVAKAGRVRLVVYDLLGRAVATLVDEFRAPGQYEVGCDASGWTSGVYFYRLQAEGFAQTRTFAVVK
jgi:hypothetical protein